MRSALGLLLGLCAAATLVVVIGAARSERGEAFNLGVTPAAPAVLLQPGARVCQGPVVIPDADSAFDRVVLVAGTKGETGPELAVMLQPAGGGTPFALGHVAGGYTGAERHAVPVGHIATREPFDVCVRNHGSQPVALHGSGELASRTSLATIAGEPQFTDVYVAFDRAEPRSALSLLGRIFDRAALWRAPWVGAWLYVLLALVVVAGVPALTAFALRSAARG